MESLPPIEGSPNSFWIWNAPNNADKGLPHFLESLPNLSKYSWKVNLIFL